MKDRAAADSEELLEHQPAVWLKQKRRTKSRTLSPQEVERRKNGVKKPDPLVTDKNLFNSE